MIIVVYYIYALKMLLIYKIFEVFSFYTTSYIVYASFNIFLHNIIYFRLDIYLITTTHLHYLLLQPLFGQG